MIFALAMVALIISIVLIDISRKNIKRLHGGTTLHLGTKTSHEHDFTRVDSKFPQQLNEDGSKAPFAVAMWCKGCDLVLTIPEYEQWASDQEERPAVGITGPPPPNRLQQSAMNVVPLVSSTPPSPPKTGWGSAADYETSRKALACEDETHLCAGKDRCDTCDRPMWEHVEHQVQQYIRHQPIQEEEDIL